MAGEGKNQVASSLLDLQPTAALEFFQIFPDPLNFGTNRINFHGGTLFGGVVTWQGDRIHTHSIRGGGVGNLWRQAFSSPHPSHL